MGFPLVIILLAAGCGVSATATSRDEEDGTPADGPSSDHPVIPTIDAGADMKVLPKRKGINERWTRFDDCVLKDLVLSDQKLFALCGGTTNHLLTCPIDQGLETVECEEFVAFDRPSLDGKPLEATPLVHNILDDRFLAVTFTSLPDHHSGFYIVDRESRQVTNSLAFGTSGVRVGNDVLPLGLTLPWGAFLLGDFLFLATRNQNFSAEEESYTAGSFSPFVWNGDGTVEPIEDELGQTYVSTSGLQATGFIEGEEPDTAFVLNNGHFQEGAPTESYFDLISLDGEGNPQVVSNQAVSLGPIPFEPLKHFAFSPDRQSLLLASQPYVDQPARVYVSGLELSEGLDVGPDQIVSAVWYSDGETEKAVLTKKSAEVLGVTIENGRPATVLQSTPVYYGDPTVSALNISEAGCFFYQGLVLDEEERQSAITAMECGALGGVN